MARFARVRVGHEVRDSPLATERVAERLPVHGNDAVGAGDLLPEHSVGGRAEFGEIDCSGDRSFGPDHAHKDRVAQCRALPDVDDEQVLLGEVAEPRRGDPLAGFRVDHAGVVLHPGVLVADHGRLLRANGGRGALGDHGVADGLVGAGQLVVQLGVPADCDSSEHDGEKRLHRASDSWTLFEALGFSGRSAGARRLALAVLAHRSAHRRCDGTEPGPTWCRGRDSNPHEFELNGV